MAERREWTVWHPDDTHPDDPDAAECGPMQVYAETAEQAAEKFADVQCHRDCDWYDSYLGDGVTLFVRGDDWRRVVHVQATQSVVFIGRDQNAKT